MLFYCGMYAHVYWKWVFLMISIIFMPFELYLHVKSRYVMILTKPGGSLLLGQVLGLEG